MSEVIAKELKPGRLVSLDVFRGLTIAAMLLVNNPGDWGHVYGPLRHAEWHGCTPTDLIFPFFLFIVGMSMSVSTRWRELDAARPWRPYWRVLKRAAILFGLGLVLALVPKFDFEHLRIMGVLQRIGVCYLMAGWMLIAMRGRWLVLVGVGLLVVPRALMAWVKVPGIDREQFGPWSLEGNLVGWVDRAVFGAQHLYMRPQDGGAMLGFDPEGLLSSLPATAQVLLGCWVGWLMMRWRTAMRWALPGRLTVIGALLVLLGWGWPRVGGPPINKQLWTSSFVLLTSGWACIVFAACFAVVELRALGRAGVWFTKPFQIYGLNAIAAFFGSGLLARLLGLIKVGPDREPVMRWVFVHGFGVIPDPYVASLAFAVSIVLLWLAILWVMASRGVFLKV